jgi:hypothetical protein
MKEHNTNNMKTPFKLKSGNASTFKNLGSSPVKQADFSHFKPGGIAPYFDISTAPKTPSGAVHPSYKPKPKWDPTKRQDVTKYVKGTKAYKAANPSTLSKITKVGKNALKKGFKFLGGKTLGVAGMLMATSSKADQPTAEQKYGYQKPMSKKKIAAITSEITDATNKLKYKQLKIGK